MKGIFKITFAWYFCKHFEFTIFKYLVAGILLAFQQVYLQRGREHFWRPFGGILSGILSANFANVNASLRL